MTQRHHYRIDLGDRTSVHEPSAQPLTTSDRESLPALMLAAYAGTTDDEGESLTEAIEEVDRWLEEGGDLIRSFGCHVDGELQSAALVAVVPRGAILAYVITHPDHKRRGLGRRCVEAALDKLHRDGHAQVNLWITEGNTPSERLFASLGANRVSD
ncbi:MAG: GNAT family N-acetyltransferase [Actinomycetota bacterium]